MTRRTCPPLCSTGFYCERADRTGAGGFFLSMSAGDAPPQPKCTCFGDLSGLSTREISAKKKTPIQPFSGRNVSCRPWVAAGKLRGRRDVLSVCCAFPAAAAHRRCGVHFRCGEGRPRTISAETVPPRCWTRAWVRSRTTSAGKAATVSSNQGHCDDPLTWVALRPDGRRFLDPALILSIIRCAYKETARAHAAAILIIRRTGSGSTPAYLPACLARRHQAAEEGTMRKSPRRKHGRA